MGSSPGFVSHDGHSVALFRLAFAAPPGVAPLSLPPQSTQRLNLPQVCALLSIPGTGILTCCPSPTLSSLGLGPTNPTRTDLPSETLGLRGTCFSHVLRYSCQHSHFRTLQPALRLTFAACGTLPYHRFAPIPGFGGVLKPRYIIRADAFDQ